MSFVNVLIIIFCSPLFFLLKGRWLGFIFNFILYCLAILTMVFFGLGVIFWAVGVAHGMWSLRKDAVHEQANAIAQAMAAELRNASVQKPA